VKKKRLFKLFISLAFTSFVAILIITLSKSKTYQILEFKALDLRFALRGNKQAQTPIVHIDLDDQSLSQLGRWPLPRSYHAKLIDTLLECGAKQILMDILFLEKLKDFPEDDALLSESISRSDMTYLPFYFIEHRVPAPKLEALLLKDITISVEEAAEALNIEVNLLKDEFFSAKKYILDEAVRDILREEPDISVEEVFAVLEDSKGWFLFPAEESYIRENFQGQKLARFFVNRFAVDHESQETLGLKEFKALNAPIKEYAESIKGSGFINAKPDQDGVMRRVPLFIKYEDKIFPQLAVASLLDSLSVKDIKITSNFITLKNARIQDKIKDIRIPVDRDGSMLINWSGHWGRSFKHIPYYPIVKLQEIKQQRLEQLSAANAEEQLSAEDAGVLEYLKSAEDELREKLMSIVKNKICIVAIRATGTQDMGSIPLQTNYPLVGTHSNLINTVITENFITKGPGALNAFIFFFTALVIGFGSLIKLWKNLLLSICYAAGYFFIAFLAFVKLGLWIDLVGPLGIVVFGFSAITSFRYFTEEREKLWIKQAFSHYLSGEVINELMEDPSKLKLGGERKNLTVLFADIRGFTKFSESHQPEEVVAILNDVLTQLVNVVFKYNGTLDKFVGDELMTFFGAPGDFHVNDHATVAVRTAIEMQSKLKELQDRWFQEKKEPLQIGIGVNTGEMVVGNMGSSKRMDYTVIGDNVNLAARLCSAAGGGQIIIGESTYERVKDSVKAEKLPPITLNLFLYIG
jgi:adenylate cyclase